MVENLARTLGEQIEQVAPLRYPQSLESTSDFPGLQDVLDTAADVGRRLQQQCAQHVGDATEHGVVRRQRLGVFAGETRYLGLGRLESPADRDRIALGQRQEIGDRALDDPQPMRCKP